MPAAYSVDLRQKVLKYLEQNNSRKSASKLFNIGESTVHRWVSQYKKQGRKPRSLSFSYKRTIKALLK